jgi:hypothetical protein
VVAVMLAIALTAAPVSAEDDAVIVMLPGEAGV